MKKIIKCLVSGIVCAGMTASVGLAADLDGYTIDDAAKTITLYGTIAGAKEYDDISIQLLKKDKEIDAEAVYDGEKIKNDFILFTQVLADSNGGYSVTVDMTDEPVGFYTMRVNGRETERKVFYSTPEEKEALNSQIKTIIAKSKETAVAELTALMDLDNELSTTVGILNLVEETIFITEADGLCEVIYTILNQDGDVSAETLAQKINIASYIQALREGKVSIEDYTEKLSLNTVYTAAYDRLPDSIKKGFTSSVFKNKNYLTQQQVSDAYNNGVLFGMVNSFNSWGDIEYYITNFGSVSGINMTSFNLLTTAKKSLLYSDVLSHGSFADADSFKDYANGLISSLLSSGVTNDVGYGGGSYGGGSYGGGIGGTTINDSQPVPTQTDEADIVEFNDLEGYEWAKESIESLAAKGIVNGVGDNKFEPERSVSREEFLAMLLRAYGIGPDITAGVPFEDVELGEWYAGYVAAAVKNGVTNGISDTLFGIGMEVTREDAAVLAYRLALTNGRTFADNKGADFADDSQISDYAADAVYAMKNSGIINGKENNEFCPKQSCTRAEAAKIIYALIK